MKNRLLGLFIIATILSVNFQKVEAITFGLSKNLSYSYTYVDSTQWFSQYAGVADEYELFPKRSTLLYPSQNLTRNEVAVAIYQYLKNR